jgi:lysozyme family protein
MNPHESDPEWDQPLTLALTPADLIHTLFTTATNVHTGWSSCVEKPLVMSDIHAMNERTGNYARLAEQEFEDTDNTEVVWHDWTVEIRLGNTLVTGHWQLQVTAAPLDWEWCTREAEAAFEKASVLMGKRIRRSLVVEEHGSPPPPDPRHH